MGHANVLRIIALSEKKNKLLINLLWYLACSLYTIKILATLLDKWMLIYNGDFSYNIILEKMQVCKLYNSPNFYPYQFYELFDNALSCISILYL